MNEWGIFVYHDLYLSMVVLAVYVCQSTTKPIEKAQKLLATMTMIVSMRFCFIVLIKWVAD